jgi:membrane protease YdiL (CAAX protease family)
VFLSRWLARCREQLFHEPLREVEGEAIALRGPAEEVRLDLKTAAVFITAAVSLTLIEYVAKGGHARLAGWLDAVGLNSVAQQLTAAMGDSSSQKFNQLAFFALGCMTGYVLLPFLVIKLCFRESLADYGLKFSGMFQCAWVYGVLLACMLPIVFAVSFTEPFLARYPFYKLATDEPFWPHFLAWEVLYALQFVALEFFFRGFLVHGTRQRLGFYSIFAMTVPYCMIHFGKPMAETFAAIIAGIVLGIMSLKTRSVMMGAISHIAVAWWMDFLALWQKGLF